MNLPGYLRPHKEGCSLDLYVVPRASKSKLVGEHDGHLKIQISAPPVDGAANKEICVFLASTFSISKSQIKIIRGKRGKRKTVEIINTSAQDILPYLPESTSSTNHDGNLV